MLSSKLYIYNFGNTFYFKQKQYSKCIFQGNTETYTHQLLNFMGAVLEAWYKDHIWQNKGWGSINWPQWVFLVGKRETEN